ncbi:helix-turn-helix domain-containing protein [Klenkia sp. PcliD-1-E]|uniref:helix-turn-helix domain-containing protein n=1 Tax=Klenkia sp. PcliD-1-E TaxID=2954492 RepID=UPI0035ABED45
MSYPPRPQLTPLPDFAGTASQGRFLDRELREKLETFIVSAYAQGRSLREIGELVDRSQTAVRRVLASHQIPLRPAGAARTGARRRPHQN